MYVDAAPEVPETPHASIAAWLNREAATAPSGGRGFEVERGITARKFVVVNLDVFEDIDDYKRRFFEWLKTFHAKGFPPEWANPKFYTFRKVGKYTRPT